MIKRNPSQQRAIAHLSGPMMVLAGPGSGKTSVIVERTAYMINEGGISPSNILVVTFSRAAAKEMKERFLSFTGQQYTPVTFGTFHGVFYGILKQIQCSGPIGGLTVTADSKANVKGYVNNPDVMLPPSKEGKLDVGKALDLGVLTVIKDIGLKEPYSGQTHLVSGEIAEDLTYYFAASEQIPTSVALGVLMNKDNTVRQAGGFIIQMMPYAEEETISKLEKKIAEFKSVTYALEHEHTPEKMMEDLLGDMDMKIYEKVPTQFHCNCSKERVEKAVISVGKKEIQNMIDDGEPIEVNCHFCNTHYHYSVDDLKRMLNEATR